MEKKNRVNLKGGAHIWPLGGDAYLSSVIFIFSTDSWQTKPSNDGINAGTKGVNQTSAKISAFQGNDQIRFELSCYALYPEVQVNFCGTVLLALIGLCCWVNRLGLFLLSGHCAMEDLRVLQTLQR